MEDASKRALEQARITPPEPPTPIPGRKGEGGIWARFSQQVEQQKANEEPGNPGN